jgi:dipeptidyl aminopeptidase/acylaminoacyl peptidase
VLADGANLFYIASDATHVSRVFRSTLVPVGPAVAIAQETWPSDFPSEKLVVPQQAIFKSGDGLEIHGQLFLPKGAKPGEKLPALIFLHGGSMRQMLLGWHYMYYYINAYAANQYLAAHGFVVLSVN